MRCLSALACGLLLLGTGIVHAGKPVAREDGAIYLADFQQPPFRLALNAATPAYFGINLQRYAGTLRFPQQVEVVAVSEDAFRVRGIAQQGQVLAWVPPDSLKDIPEGLVENLQLAEERRKTVEALIANNEVAIGMTLEEVRRSVGRPQKTTNRASAEGTEQIWEYVRYRQVPQETIVNTPSGPATSWIYVRIPVGSLEVLSRDGTVVAIEQTEGTLATGRPSIVVPPLIAPW